MIMKNLKQKRIVKKRIKARQKFEVTIKLPPFQKLANFLGEKYKQSLMNFATIAC